jgi:translation initiation factor IF-2
MSQRLVKVAKELNVGTDSIVEYLGKKGIVIEAKPTTMITDEMHHLLLQEFSSNRAIKEQADSMIIGARPAKADATSPVAEPIKKETPATKPAEKTVKKAEIQEEDKPKLKVLGKIDLTPKAKETKPVEEKPVEVTPPVAEEIKVAPPVEEKQEDEVVKAEAPQLQGLTILGKIDTNKFEPSKAKKAEKEKEKEKAGAKAKKDKESVPLASSDTSIAQKRKRKRKKLSSESFDSSQGQRRPGSPGGDNRGGSTTAGGRRPTTGGRFGRDENKEVSKKEIDDQIRATMARLSGGKSKRQKIRRDSRKDKADKQ